MYIFEQLAEKVRARATVRTPETVVGAAMQSQQVFFHFFNKHFCTSPQHITMTSA